MTTNWWDDDTLLNDLAEAVRAVDSPARELADQVRGLYAWRTVDEDLMIAALSFDSASEETPALRATEPSESPGVLSPTRAEPGEGRVLIFHAEPLSVELEVQSDQIVGQIVPPAPGEVRVEVATPTGCGSRPGPRPTSAGSSWCHRCARTGPAAM